MSPLKIHKLTCYWQVIILMELNIKVDLDHLWPFMNLWPFMIISINCSINCDSDRYCQILIAHMYRCLVSEYSVSLAARDIFRAADVVVSGTSSRGPWWFHQGTKILKPLVLLDVCSTIPWSKTTVLLNHVEPMAAWPIKKKNIAVSHPHHPEYSKCCGVAVNRTVSYMGIQRIPKAQWIFCKDDQDPLQTQISGMAKIPPTISFPVLHMIKTPTWKSHASAEGLQIAKTLAQIRGKQLLHQALGLIGRSWGIFQPN